MRPDPRLRVRVYVAGAQVAETWLDVSNPDVADLAGNVSRQHSAIARAAEAADQLWAVEVWDPEGRMGQVFGTDQVTVLRLGL